MSGLIVLAWSSDLCFMLLIYKRMDDFIGLEQDSGELGSNPMFNIDFVCDLGKSL